MSKESDALLIARFSLIPLADWGTPLPITNLKTREVRYACRLCVGQKPVEGWEIHPTDEAVILKHIEEVHGLKSEASVYVSPEEAQRNCKAVSVDCFK
jgi:hypothetical protein